MNLKRKPLAAIRLAFSLVYSLCRFLPKQTSNAFGSRQHSMHRTIEKIYVINLDREPGRWSRVEGALRRILNRQGNDLLSLTERCAAVDARSFLQDPAKDADVDPIYTLADQLFVEPQPQALPTLFELEAPIRMSRAEVAVAKSHIGIWRRIAQGGHGHALILEDDVWFHPSFSRHLDQAWKDVENANKNDDGIDILYVSYVEANRGAPKSFMSTHSFKPVRALWHLSGYVLSKQGAEKLLHSLPCRGPIDLWINQQFESLNVFATRRALVRQRRDAFSSNSYSILPTLSKIGAINSETAALFNVRPDQLPVFTFGAINSGQSSLAMALSMLGYRCCSDLDSLPPHELNQLRNGMVERVFNAYANIGCLDPIVEDLRCSYPQAKFIVTASLDDVAGDIAQGILRRLEGADVILFDHRNPNPWRILCEHLRCVPPLCLFPRIDDQGQRHVVEASVEPSLADKRSKATWDRSPWIVEPDHLAWRGIEITPQAAEGAENWAAIANGSSEGDQLRWSARSDTFPGNLALFRSENVQSDSAGGAKIHVRRENLGVRRFSAGALTSNVEYLFGRFESNFKASNVPGVITGFFLHRNSPHQEIDIEIAGNMPSRLLVNVFYNPGSDGAKFDYGYRGSPSYIDLGFDASKDMHQYAIEWTPSEIRWLVDGILVHRRVLWNPTPIPHLPMKLHFNAWPSRASQLAGRLKSRQLPAVAEVQALRARARGPSLPTK